MIIMIQKEELRIGNHLNIISGINEVVIITEVKSKYLSYQTESRIGEAVFQCFEPIQLTEEWLLRFGYEIYPWGYVKENSPLIRFSLVPSEKYWVELGNGFIINLPFVHTFQNFISLTGQELAIVK